MKLRQRDPREECPTFLAFLRRHPCCACGAPAPSQAAHVRFSDAAAGHENPGVGAKPHDRRAVPLCADCHLDAPDSQHRVGDERKFWARVGKNPDEIAARFWGQFVRRGARSPEKREAVVARAKRRVTRIKREGHSGPKPKVSANRLASEGDPQTEEPSVIDRQGGKILIECDSCDEVFEGEQHDEWSEVWPAAQREGWKSRKIAGEWLHGCPKCGAPT